VYYSVYQSDSVQDTSTDSLKTDDWQGSMGISATAAPQSGN